LKPFNQPLDLNILRSTAHNLRWAVQPEGVIPLTAADPDFPVAMPIREAIQDLAMKGHFHYGPVEGLPRFKESMANFFQIKRGVNYQSSHILPADSAAAAIDLVCRTFLGPGDEAIILDPVDFLFRYSIEAAGATAVPFRLGGPDSMADFSRINALVNENTSMICLCNPVNPTGKVFSREELEELAKVAEAHGLLLLSDEIWSDIVFPPVSFTSMAAVNQWSFQNTITVTGFSKSYGMAGLRIGAIALGSGEHYRMLLANSGYQSTIRGVPVIAQEAAVAALERGGEWLEEFRNHLLLARNYTVNRLNAIPGFKCTAPDGCFVAFVDVRELGMDAGLLADFLLSRSKVAVVPGLPRWFGDGAAGHIRISFATSMEILEESMDRITHTISSL
jgi:aspartate/methionine/tyrosine aminotransferase